MKLFNGYGKKALAGLAAVAVLMLISGIVIGGSVQNAAISSNERKLEETAAGYEAELSSLRERAAALEGTLKETQTELDGLKGIDTLTSPSADPEEEPAPAAADAAPAGAPAPQKGTNWLKWLIIIFIAVAAAASITYTVYCVVGRRRFPDEDEDEYEDEYEDYEDGGDEEDGSAVGDEDAGEDEAEETSAPDEPTTVRVKVDMDRVPVKGLEEDKAGRDTVLSVQGLKKSFGSLDVLRDISFDLERGKIISILGPSGGGKSTLLRCLTQLETIDDGLVTVDGDVLFKDGKYAPKADLKRMTLKIGLVFQNFNLFPHLSVMENLTTAMIKVKKTPKGEAVKRARSLLERVGLGDKADCYPYQLSGGQQQRVAIARALALDPEVLFFDEPTSALDPELTGEVLKVIRGLADRHMTMIIVTHEMGFARSVSDRVIFMENGVIVEDAPPEELFTNPKNPRTRDFIASVMDK